ncbi:hypothetical protein FA13DRAFT_1725242, partial [Coprinellus micaceus]
MDDNGMNSKRIQVLDMLAETKAELDEFHHASKELEAELEAELARTEKAQMELKVKRDDWKSKFMSLQTTHNTTTTSLQRELDKLRKEYQQLKVQLRELEMGNDDLERNERAVSSSLADMEAKYARVLEEKILLEQELLEKVSLEESTQRLKDEVRDASEEIAILKNKLAEAAAAKDRAVADALKEYKSSMPPPVSTPSPRKMGRQPDLDLADLSPTSSSSSSHVSTPRNNRLNKSNNLLNRSGINSRDSPLAALRTSGFKPAPTSLYSPSTSQSSRLPLRGTPVRSSTSGSSFASGSTTTTTSTTSKSKGVQMVSEMRARVRNLEAKIQTRVPRLRMASITGRNSMSSNVSSVPSCSSSASNHSTAKTSIDSGRPSPDSRKSSESLEKQAKRDAKRDLKRDNGDSGWVLIMEDANSPAPTPVKDPAPHSPSLSTGPPTAYLSGTGSMSGRRSQARLSGGSSSTSTVRPAPSRPTSPSLLPMPTSSYGMKRSTGPGTAGSPFAQSTPRVSLTSSAYAAPDFRSRSTAVPPLPTHKDDKALPQVPNHTSVSGVTVRASKSVSGAASVSSLLSKSRIGRPISGRRSNGGDTSPLDLNDLRPRSGSNSGGFFGN